MLTPDELSRIRDRSTATRAGAQERSGAVRTGFARPIVTALVLLTAVGAATAIVRARSDPEAPAVTTPPVSPTPSPGPDVPAAGVLTFFPIPLAPTPSASPTRAATPPPQEGVAPVAPAPTPSRPRPAIAAAVTPAKAAPGSIFRFRFAGLRANENFMAELLPPPPGRREEWSGTVPADGIVVLTWQSPLDAPTGLWQIALAQLGGVTIGSFEHAR